MAMAMAMAMATANNTPPCTAGHYRSQLAINLHVYDRKGQIELDLAGFGKHDPALIGILLRSVTNQAACDIAGNNALPTAISTGE